MGESIGREWDSSYVVAAHPSRATSCSSTLGEECSATIEDGSERGLELLLCSRLISGSIAYVIPGEDVTDVDLEDGAELGMY